MLFGASGILYAFAEFEIFSDSQTPLYFAARVVYLPGAVLIAAFTARVFRPDAGWARWLVWGVAVLLVVAVGGSALQGDWGGFSLSDAWFWLDWVGYTLPFGWAAAEAFPQYRRARRRVRIGLCEPSVCNRMLLWSMFGVIQLVGCFVVIGQYATYEREKVFSALWDILYSGTILAALVAMWLTFFPPKSYLRWINRATTQAESAGGG
jgi:ABC-type phosphate/phosphonate transport system permease subunit